MAEYKPMPFNTSIKLRPGMSIAICGCPNPNNFNRFNINFCVGDPTHGDIVFHCDVRNRHSDGLNKAIVRNTRMGGTWQIAERDVPSFPFQQGVYFEMVISLERNNFFKVAVNNKHLLEYHPQRALDPSKVNHLNIDGDLNLKTVQIK